MKYVSDAGAPFKRSCYILNSIVLPWRRSVLTAPNDVHSDKSSVGCYFDLFYNIWKRRIYLYYCKLCNMLFL